MGRSADVQLILPYVDVELKYYDLGMENRDAVRSCLLVRGSEADIPDQRPSNDRFRRGYQAILCRCQVRDYHA